MSNNGTSQITEQNLRQFTGTYQWYRHALFRHLIYTEGVQFLESHGCGWLVDVIVSHIATKAPLRSAIRAQLATDGIVDMVAQLRLNSDNSARFVIRDGGSNRILSRQSIDMTDCPIDLDIMIGSDIDIDKRASYILYLPSER